MTAPTTVDPAVDDAPLDDLHVTTHLLDDPDFGPVIHLDAHHLTSLWPTGEVMHAVGLLTLDEAEQLVRDVAAQVAQGRAILAGRPVAGALR